jgi:hypothetical protein
MSPRARGMLETVSKAFPDGEDGVKRQLSRLSVMFTRERWTVALVVMAAGAIARVVDPTRPFALVLEDVTVAFEAGYELGATARRSELLPKN